jgi:membrane-associated HD superfamily phosphohydrolase
MMFSLDSHRFPRTRSLLPLQISTILVASLMLVHTVLMAWFRSAYLASHSLPTDVLSTLLESSLICSRSIWIIMMVLFSASVRDVSFHYEQHLMYLSLAWSQAAVGHPAKRSSSATTYLGDQFIGRPNLHVLLHAQATKILKTGTVKGKPSFHAVEFGNGTSSSGQLYYSSNEFGIC